MQGFLIVLIRTNTCVYIIRSLPSSPFPFHPSHISSHLSLHPALFFPPFLPQSPTFLSFLFSFGFGSQVRSPWFPFCKPQGILEFGEDNHSLTSPVAQKATPFW